MLFRIYCIYAITGHGTINDVYRDISTPCAFDVHGDTLEEVMPAIKNELTKNVSDGTLSKNVVDTYLDEEREMTVTHTLKFEIMYFGAESQTLAKKIEKGLWHMLPEVFTLPPTEETILRKVG